MLSKRDNLLSRPWQLRRYENHRRKVQSALPAIDVGPPAQRGHVCCKLKKSQFEKERCVKIEQDNLKLLQRLEAIMKKNRLDNRWMTPQPNFLQRVGIYHDPSVEYSTPPSRPTAPSPASSEDAVMGPRKARCTACRPPKTPLILIDERLLPWEEEFSNKLNKETSKSVTSLHTQLPPASDGKKQARILSPPIKPVRQKVFSDERSETDRKHPQKNREQVKTPSIIISRGPLKLSVNFPSDTEVKFRNGNVERYILRDLCKCSSLKNAI